MFSSELFSFQGRVSRSKFWLVFLLSIFVSFVVVLFSILAIPALIFIGTFSPTVASIVSILLYVLMIPMWWISIATTVKRFHDRNKSGWWYLIVLIPIIGELWLIIENGFLKGTSGSNNFGEDPLLPSAITATPSFTGPASFAPPTASTGTSAGMLIVYIVVSVILIALLGRLGWAFLQVQKDEASVANTSVNVPTTAVLSNIVACGSEDCFYQKFATCEPASFQTAIQGPNSSAYYEIIGQKTGGCEMTFKYPVNPNPEWVNKPMTCVFNNKVDFNTSVVDTITKATNGTANCVGPLFEILRSVTSVVPTKISTPTTTPTKTVVSSTFAVNEVYVSGNDIFIEGQHLLRVTSETIEGSTCIYLGNDAGFQESFGDKKITMAGYARCLPKVKPNYVTLSWNSDHGRKEEKFLISQTIPASVVSRTSSLKAGVPTATYTANGVTNLSVKVGDSVTFAWSSTNADHYIENQSVSGCKSPDSNYTQQPYGGTVSGTISITIPIDITGCTISTTFTAKNTLNGKQATATATISVK